MSFKKFVHFMLCSLGGGALGVIFVKVFCFTTLENLGWSLYWNGTLNPDIALSSGGAMKCLVGCIVGVLIGMRVAYVKELIEIGV